MREVKPEMDQANSNQHKFYKSHLHFRITKDTKTMETVGNKVVSILLTILPRWLNGPDPLLHTPATQVSPSWGKKVSSDNNICLFKAENHVTYFGYFELVFGQDG